MTYRDKFHSLDDWKQKILVMQFFHLLMLSKRKGNWHLHDTASYFKVSMALVSENLKLASSIDDVENCSSRVKALNLLKELK